MTASFRSAFPLYAPARSAFLLRALPMAAMLLLGACAEQQAAPPSLGFTPASRPATALIGSDARSLQRQFGTPRLDIRDPTARKLQFANERCVLDAYLYPPGDNREPLVTYAEARSLQGNSIDPNACAKSLREGK